MQELLQRVIREEWFWGVVIFAAIMILKGIDLWRKDTKARLTDGRQ